MRLWRQDIYYSNQQNYCVFATRIDALKNFTIVVVVFLLFSSLDKSMNDAIHNSR